MPGIKICIEICKRYCASILYMSLTSGKQALFALFIQSFMQVLSSSSFVGLEAIEQLYTLENKLSSSILH